MSESEALALYRERSATVDDVRWALSDVALLDDVRDVLGPRPGKGGKIDELDEIRTYGHIVIDEVQDLTPMQLKMATRRSLSGAMTIVGDLAQATGPLAPRRVGRRARPPARPQAGARHWTVGRVSDPGSDHGARQQSDGGGNPFAACTGLGPRWGCVADNRAGALDRAARQDGRRTRSWRLREQSPGRASASSPLIR